MGGKAGLDARANGSTERSFGARRPGQRIGIPVITAQGHLVEVAYRLWIELTRYLVGVAGPMRN